MVIQTPFHVNSFSKPGGGDTHIHKHAYRCPHQSDFKKPGAHQPVPDLKYRHLAELDLADFFYVGDELQIDAQIGLDHY